MSIRRLTTLSGKVATVGDVVITSGFHKLAGKRLIVYDIVPPMVKVAVLPDCKDKSLVAQSLLQDKLDLEGMMIEEMLTHKEHYIRLAGKLKFEEEKEKEENT